MGVTEARRLNLIDLERAHSTLERVAELTGSSAGHLSQIKNRVRGMGHNVARRFEQRLGLPPDWMDTRDHAPAQGSLEATALLNDYRNLPPALQAHIADKAAELRKLWDSIPATLRPLISEPPRDPERYREWEAHIKAFIQQAAAKD